MTIEQELIKAQAESSKATQDLAAANDALSKAKAKLETAQETIATLMKERDSARSDSERLTAALEKSNTDHTAALEAKEADVERRAHAKAGEIARNQGVKPVTEETTSSNKLIGVDLVAQLEGITDPIERTKFYRANKAAIDAAYTVK